jgi:hypothetical protein
MEDPYEGLGRSPLSRFRIIGLVIFALLMLGFYAYTTPDSIAHAYLTGQCFKRPLPNPCRLPSQRVVIPPALLNVGPPH